MTNSEELQQDIKKIIFKLAPHIADGEYLSEIIKEHVDELIDELEIVGIL